ncbi:reverse transcriptase domain-containing protein [Tanacetum coccineum]
MKKSDFQWTAEAEVTFKQMKQLIAELPTLTAPMEKEELIEYLVAAREAVSAVLMTEREARKMPVYFVSRALQGPKINYTSMENLVLTLVHASKRLKIYFKVHTIIVIVDQPIKQVLSRLEVAGRLQKWSIELVEEELPDPWTLFTDGSSCVDGSGAGLILTNPEGAEFTYALRFRFDETNNEAEYEALIVGLRIAEQMGIKNLQAHVDSRLVANQVNESYIAKESGMVQYLKKVRTLASNFKKFLIKQVPGSENKKADALSKIASTSFAHLTKQHACRNKIRGRKSNTNKILLANNAHGCKENNSRMPRLPGSPPRAKEPAIKTDSHHLAMPFYKWGIDISGPFREGPGKVKFLIVAIDYFTKWIEAKPVATITGNQIKKFVWDNIVCRFGLPGEIIFDNEKQFRDNPFKDWCEKLCIRQRFASLKHPQANGLVERANRSLREGIKARVDERSKDWIEEIPHVLWAHSTMIKSSNGDIPFSLTYGTEAVIPAEIGMTTLRTAEIDMVQNDEALEINLDLLEEEVSKLPSAKQEAMQRWKNITTLSPQHKFQTRRPCVPEQ